MGLNAATSHTRYRIAGHFRTSVFTVHYPLPTAHCLFVLLYWQIRREILQKQRELGWGAKVVEWLVKDLRREFPEMKGFSRTNILYMRAFAEAYEDVQFVQQVVGQIPWGHNVRILPNMLCATSTNPSAFRLTN